MEDKEVELVRNVKLRQVHKCDSNNQVIFISNDALVVVTLLFQQKSMFSQKLNVKINQTWCTSSNS